MKFESSQKANSQIPLSSMPDIVFMLLLFFMVATVFKEFSGLPITLPQAKMIEKLEGKRNVVYLWANQDGVVSVDDNIIQVDQLSSIMNEKLVANPRLIASMKIDRDAKMEVVTGIQQELREAFALRVNYSAKPAAP